LFDEHGSIEFEHACLILEQVEFPAHHVIFTLLRHERGTLGQEGLQLLSNLLQGGHMSAQLGVQTLCGGTVHGGRREKQLRWADEGKQQGM
jgi:hypothetical protein